MPSTSTADSTAIPKSLDQQSSPGNIHSPPSQVVGISFPPSTYDSGKDDGTIPESQKAAHLDKRSSPSTYEDIIRPSTPISAQPLTLPDRHGAKAGNEYLEHLHNDPWMKYSGLPYHSRQPFMESLSPPDHDKIVDHLRDIKQKRENPLNMEFVALEQSFTRSVYLQFPGRGQPPRTRSLKRAGESPLTPDLKNRAQVKLIAIRNDHPLDTRPQSKFFEDSARISDLPYSASHSLWKIPGNHIRYIHIPSNNMNWVEVGFFLVLIQYILMVRQKIIRTLYDNDRTAPILSGRSWRGRQYETPPLCSRFLRSGSMEQESKFEYTSSNRGAEH